MPWASSLQSLTALSTVQSELVATILCMKETCYTQDLLRELEFKDWKKSASDITPLEHSPSFHNRVHSTDQAPTTTQEVLQRALREWTDRLKKQFTGNLWSWFTRMRIEDPRKSEIHPSYTYEPLVPHRKFLSA